METLNALVSQVNSVVWGPLMLILILGVGFFLQAGLKVMPIRKIGYGFGLLWKGRLPPPASPRAAGSRRRSRR